MDTGTGLALRAVLLGLRRSGQLGEHALTVISDELRLAAAEARHALFDQEADRIEQLIVQLHDGSRIAPSASRAGVAGRPSRAWP